MHKIPTLKSATARFAIRYPVTEKENNVKIAKINANLTFETGSGKILALSLLPTRTLILHQRLLSYKPG